ncbi:hypothetical protein [Acinetobacter brisouii]|nr:hypothetical protein [Acinetobacter brisouii]
MNAMSVASCLILQVRKVDKNGLQQEFDSGSLSSAGKQSSSV